MMRVLLSLPLLPLDVDAHGYMTKPSSRTDQAYEDRSAQSPA